MNQIAAETPTIVGFATSAACYGMADGANQMVTNNAGPLWNEFRFDGPMATVFLRLGAFPVRRGESDAEALETARAILRRGDALARMLAAREEIEVLPEARVKPLVTMG